VDVQTGAVEWGCVRGDPTTRRAAGI